MAVARRGGFAAAAAELNLSPSAVSHAVRTVEDRLGVPVFARTTRSVHLTEAGAAFVAALGPAFSDIAEAMEHARSTRDNPAGLLRINTSHVAIRMVLTEIVTEMALAHPNVTVELFADDSLTDIVAEGFDAGVRLGEMISQDMVAVRLTPPFQAIMAASPDYLARHETPQTIADLSDHACVGFRLPGSGGLYRWDLVDAGEPVEVDVSGPLILSDASQAVETALADIGIVYVFEPLVRDLLADGRLVQVLPEASCDEPGLFLYFPQRATQAPKLRAFVDIARRVCARRS